MGSVDKETAQEILPWIRVYKDGTFEKLAGTDTVPAGFDSQTGVESKDIIISPETNLSVRIYRPNRCSDSDNRLPVVVYFHGGAFIMASTAEPLYHSTLNQTVAAANVILVSVDYRRCPEYPLPAAYDDSRAALRWVSAHSNGGGTEPWLTHMGDLERLFIAGDSAGANIAHHMAVPNPNLGIRGILMINPYFWGKDPIGEEESDPARKGLVDSWWEFVCKSGKGCDDPMINPFADGDGSSSPASLSGLGCERILIWVSQRDILKERGKLYYEKLKKSGWPGKAELKEMEGEDHVFHIFNPSSDKAQILIKSLASFINQH